MSQVMPPSTETANHFLTAEQLQQFEHDGYLRVEGVIDPEAFIDPLFADYALVLDRLANELYDRGEIDATYDDLPFGERMIRVYQDSGRDHARFFDCSLPNRDVKPDTHMWLGPSVFHLLTHPGVLDVVESVIGSEITSNPVQHVRIKPPEKALPDGATDVLVRANPWHQDNGVVDPIADATHMLTVWISLSAATPENGCLRVIPGSHRGALRTHCLNPVAIPDALLELDRVTPVPTEPGDVIIFNKYTCHGSGPNVSDHFRVSLDLRYNPTGQPTGRPAFPDFVARSRHDPSSELRDPVAWAQLWYDARTRLAEKGENFAFRWRGDEPVCA